MTKNVFNKATFGRILRHGKFLCCSFISINSAARNFRSSSTAQNSHYKNIFTDNSYLWNVFNKATFGRILPPPRLCRLRRTSRHGRFPHRHQSLNQRGSSMLEMVLFTPLALMFLFLVIDGGLYLSSGAAVTDALRAGFNHVAIISKEHRVVDIDHGLEVRYHQDRAESFLEELSSKIDDQMKKSFGTTPYKIKLAFVWLDLDQATGKVRNYEIRDTLTIPHSVEHPELPGNGNSYPYVSIEQYLANTFNATHPEPSPYALPLSLAYDGGVPNSGALQYLNHALVIYGEIDAITLQRAHFFAKSIMGRFYGVERQELIL
ncbi:pilus assembly protein, partial [bacterium]|nr:pilus assembly protein [bacterium]